MTNVHRAVAAIVIWAAAIAAPASARQAGSHGDDRVAVTVKYTGKGDVDATHRLWVWLFDTPDIGPGSMPIDERALDANGGTVTFTGIRTPQVWIAVAYDAAGGFTGQAAPPPGSPIAMYGRTADMPPQPVTPGAKGAVTVTFDDAFRMQ